MKCKITLSDRLFSLNRIMCQFKFIASINKNVFQFSNIYLDEFELHVLHDKVKIPRSAYFNK